MSRFAFKPEQHEEQLVPLIGELAKAKDMDSAGLTRILRRYPKDGCGLFSKSEIVRGFRHLRERHFQQVPEETFVERIRMKPIRTLSGVAPVTVLTKPHPCPGKCIFCPSDVRMPKSYLSDEPGAQRAAQHQFDPYRQTLSRLESYHNNGHRTDKVELIILGGTWSSYPESYQLWFLERCFDAMNDFGALTQGSAPEWPVFPAVDFRTIDESIDGRLIEQTYNQIVSRFLDRTDSTSDRESATWQDLQKAQQINELANARCVGLVVETRPDHLTLEEVVRIRRLGATKVQLGYQSLDDAVLALNHRGHDVASTRRAMKLLRQAGLKLHAHWMPNLYGSTPDKDIEDYRRIFADPDFRPDELKIYPCSLIESAELMAYYEDGRWQPYNHEELLEVLSHCLLETPEYCRLTRIIRDIPGTDIVSGNKMTNFRELVEEDLARRGLASRDIRSREIRHRNVEFESLDLRETEYDTSVGREVFLQYVTQEDRIAGFLRLSLPTKAVPIAEIATSAMIREVHVYGQLTGIGKSPANRAQHTGLGRKLADRAGELAAEAGYDDLAVISSVGTREYYRGLGFFDGEMYQHKRVG